MKLLFIYKYLTLGGVETVLRARMEGLSPYGIEGVAWFLREIDGRPIFSGMENRIQSGSIDSLARFVRLNAFDAIIPIDTEEVFGLLGSEAASTVRILESHSPYVENLEYLREIPAGLFDAVVIPSQHQLGQVRKRLSVVLPLYIAPNPLGKPFAQALQTNGFTPSFPILAWMGRLDALKNWRAFLTVCARVAKHHPEVRFWIIGRTSEPGVETDLFSEARRLGILKSLRWFRNMSHDFIPSILDVVKRSGGVYISTSRGESFGMTVAEAMSRACPVVAPRLPPMEEFLSDHRDGRFYHGSDWRQAAAIVMEILRDDEARKRLGQNARMSILKKHEAGIAVEAYIRLLDRVVRGTRKVFVQGDHRFSTAGRL